ncbi:ABC transporter ATP-binding protein [Atopobacter phocae]|uniref:ABC transporter ATP-binding protein n=1 Tax=Atopobacter phocae TaxID=136492 RepID=UPI0004B66C5F|nr:ABC transporter ATP-binding protein [Atopobacter phocae]
MKQDISSKRLTNWQLIKRIRPYFMKYKWILLLDLMCASLTTVSEMTLPLIMRRLTNYGIYNIESLTVQVITRLALWFVLFKVIELVANYFMTSVGHIMGAKIETDMRSHLFKHLQTLPDAYYNENKVGHLMSRLTNDLFDITEFAHHCPEEYFIGAIKMIVALIVLGQIHLPLALIIFCLIPIMFLTATIFRSKMRDAQLMQRQQVGNLNANIEESLLGIRVVKSFANEAIEEEKFEEDNQHFLSIKKSFYYAMAGFHTVTKIFDGLMYFSVLVGGGLLMLYKQIDAGDMIVFIMYVNTLFESVKRIVQFTEQFQKGMTGIERYQETLETTSDLYDAAHAIELENVQGDIEFDQVDFRYPSSEEEVLTQFSFHIKAGSKVAFVGPSGAGKSTICHLIPRFYDVSSGAIRVDGKDVRDVTMKSLRDQIGIVQQDVYLFSGSVLDNIRYGKPNASEAEVIRAAELAGAADFINELPEGYHTYVGERGVRLSGGQKQRISIARVFLKNPPILILDEATSALDNQSELIVQESLEQLAVGRTTVTIAHRLTTVEDSDIIYVMGNTGIIEQGPHEELMAKKGYYYQLYTRSR